jgi:hypothetical protein
MDTRRRVPLADISVLYVFPIKPMDGEGVLVEPVLCVSNGRECFGILAGCQGDTANFQINVPLHLRLVEQPGARSQQGSSEQDRRATPTGHAKRSQ